MKGAIANCLKGTIVTKFGQPKWEDILVASGQNPNMTILSSLDVDDAIVLQIVNQSCKVLNLTLAQVADLFGDYWMNTFAVKTYKAYYGTNSTAKEFFLKLNDCHNNVTLNMPNARPPKFNYNWTNENTLVLTYISERGLIDFVVGLAKGVGRYFHEKLVVRKISSTQVEIVFL